MSDKVRVFVSHHHSPEEDAFTARLVADLETAGADVWVDVVGVGAADFQERINQALESCQWLVFVMTPASLASPWVRTEVHAAIRLMMQGRMRGIIQILAQPVTQEQIPPTWGVYAHFDATQDYDTALNLTLRELGLMPHPIPPKNIPTGRFPSYLGELGYTWRVIGGVEVIFPPLCDVPAGPVVMGSQRLTEIEEPDEESYSAFRVAKYDQETPQHSVLLNAFQIARYPVTVAEYACFINATGRAEPTGEDAWFQVSWQTQRRKLLSHPVVNVTWQDAVAYAAWLAERTQRLWRLPSEAEWEKAARGTDGRRYPWGNTFETTLCNTDEGGMRTTTPVGTFPRGASPYGAQDMAGNVWELTSSLYAPYPYVATDGRERAESTNDRVIRGGSCKEFSGFARVACRGDVAPNDAAGNIGFRVVLAAPIS